ncbi:hypothetical protein C8F04DRAFT_1260344 [Mycena alexandri]|uniref:Uncharacterized protein n=1 Tax=Mycena alexandri TaxID=1745969 RepID=A0AAD6SUL7_9AGAR|nr:hypothetical protein C8F04DRAFT_1260344 [Mycena alexandri]
MATFRITSITTEKRSSRRFSLSSITSFASTDSLVSVSNEHPIVVTTTVSNTSMTYPATVPPPFTTSLGSDEILPRPRRGAPPVAPAKNAEERKKAKQAGGLRALIGLKRVRMDPALCEGWWWVLISISSVLNADDN